MFALSFGEMLFDCFPTYERIGGAPLNSAAHISALGGRSAVISAVGDDGLGRRARREIASLGVSDMFLRTSPFPTGRADIRLSAGGDADYTFNEPAAWDDITLGDCDRAEISGMHVDAFIYGTLASRGKVSRNTLYWLLDNVHARHFFFDVNFRKDLYDDEILMKGMDKATILKVNEDELPIVMDLYDVGTPEGLLSAGKLEYLLLTLGEKGATLYTRNEAIHEDIVPGKVVDTVGAGDSLSAAFLFFLERDRDEKTALRKASAVSSFVVSSEGAVPRYDESLLESLLN